MMLLPLVAILAIASTIIARPTPSTKREMSRHVSRPQSWVGKDVLTDLSGQDDSTDDIAGRAIGSTLSPRREHAPGTSNLPLPLEWYTQAAAMAQGCYCQGSLLNPGTQVGDAKLLSHTGDGSDTQKSLVYYSDSLGIVLAYQGTNTSALESAWHDVDFVWKDPDAALGSVPSGALVDRGFQYAFLATWPTVKNLVSAAQRQYPGKRLTIVGHSLGAAMAELAAAAYAGQASTVITFGNPRVGNRAWANYIDSVYGPSKFNHVTNGRDWVPHVVPYAFGARQPSGEIWINPANSTGWMYYPGQENTNGADKVAYHLELSTADHEGWYFGVHLAARGANCPVQIKGY